MLASSSRSLLMVMGSSPLNRACGPLGVAEKTKAISGKDWLFHLLELGQLGSHTRKDESGPFPHTAHEIRSGWIDDPNVELKR